jgi:tetratricopeptide (TPR) repeat protein
MTANQRNEYFLKGLFLGLWAYFALQVPADDSRRAWHDIEWVLGWVCCGLLLGLIGGAALQISRGLRPWQNWAAFPLLVVLESPTFVYGGIMLGLIGGTLSGRPFSAGWAGPLAGAFGIPFEDIKHTLPDTWLGYCLVGGLLFGLGLYRMRQVQDRTWRFWLGIVVAGLMVYLAKGYLHKLEGFEDATARYYLGVYLLLGAPFFYLLTFCGDAEESEVEVMALCSLLGVGFSLMAFAGTFPGIGPVAPYLIPTCLYFVYATQMMPNLRVFKHALRGYSYMNLGRLSLAAGFFRRALELDPKSRLARQGMLALHNSLTLAKLDRDPALAASLDFTLCLDRAGHLLMTPPTAEQQQEAERFLELVEQKEPAYLPRVDYLRMIALLHAKRYDAAAETLARLLDPEAAGYHPAVRKQVLYDAWDFALRAHPRLVERLGWSETNKPGRRMEAIAAVERKLAAAPDDPLAKEYQTVLYSQLSEAEFVAAIGPDGQVPAEFNYDYLEQLGLALVDSADGTDRGRGMDFLRIAGRGLPSRGPGIFLKLAQVYEKLDDGENARKSLESVKKVGLGVGPGNLAKEQRQAYFEALRRLADLADRRGDYETAIEELRQYQTDGGTAVLETYRQLAELYGKQHDAMNALLMTETGLMYNSSDPDLLRKKDSYYYSVEPDRLERVKDRVVKWFDVPYCIRKATGVLNMKDGGPDMLDWAAHLTALAKVMKPESHGVRLIEARVRLRRGDRDGGLQVLEDIHYSKEKGSGDEEDAWYTATKLLGQLYLEELNKPDLALHCFVAYKDYHKSGANTLFQIARCYEALGDTANAIRFYAAVTGYDGHPRYWDAKDAMARLKGEGAA